MTEPRIDTSGERPTISLVRDLPSTPEQVWRALTDREELRRWFPCDVDVVDGTWIVGALITFRFPPDVLDLTMNGRVLIVDEPHLLCFEWGDEILRFEIERLANGARLTLFDTLAAAHAARNAAGWDDCLALLSTTTDNGEPWRARFDRYRTRFEPLLGAQEGPPEGYKASL